MIIGHRILKLSNSVDVNVRIFLPVFQDGNWSCRYEIEWPDEMRASSGFGVDSMQAIYLTLQKIGHEIYMSEHHASGELAWSTVVAGYGFPVPRNDRDILVGDDKRFDG